MANTLGSQAEMERSIRGFVEVLRGKNTGGFSAMLAPEFLSCDWEEKTLLLRFPMESWMVNTGGIAHGGILSAALDIAMGAQVYYWAGNQMPPTISLQLSFHRSIHPGAVLYVKARVTHAGRTICYTTADAWTDLEPDRIFVTATGIYHVPQS